MAANLSPSYRKRTSLHPFLLKLEVKDSQQPILLITTRNSAIESTSKMFYGAVMLTMKTFVLQWHLNMQRKILRAHPYT